MYAYLLNKSNLDLSSAELLSQTKTKEVTQIENVSLIKELLNYINYRNLAYTKKIYEVLFLSSKDSFIDDFKEYDFNKVYKENFKLAISGCDDFDLKELADIIWDKLDKPRAEMKDPKTNIEIIFLGSKVLCGLLLWENREAFEDRRAHLRPNNHPTSLHPRLARAMINLASSKEILDPFCGSGGLLLEAALAKIKAIGYDINEYMIKRAKNNLKHYKVDAFLEKKDALSLNTDFEAIVTDVPYGKNSKVSDMNNLMTKFLEVSSKHTNKMIIAFPDFAKAEKQIKKSSWKIKNKFNVYLHKSLSKEIFVLENA